MYSFYSAIQNTRCSAGTSATLSLRLNIKLVLVGLSQPNDYFY